MKYEYETQGKHYKLSGSPCEIMEQIRALDHGAHDREQTLTLREYVQDLCCILVLLGVPPIDTSLDLDSLCHEYLKKSQYLPYLTEHFVEELLASRERSEPSNRVWH